MDTEKLDLESPDLVNENFEKLAALFPNCVTESTVEKNGVTEQSRSIDFDLLKQELSHAVVEGNNERYRLEWPGKREAIVTANLPTTKTLRPVREDSVDFDNTENLYIEGDNLEVLKLLQESYLGKIKMIYIDPPYNTGKDFVYKDNFSKDAQEELIESGQKDEYNQRLVANPETAGRYHSDWLSMMYPRLKLARNLLTQDGVIFISIDDNEVHHLRKVCDEIFGEYNFVAQFIHKNNSNKNQANLVSVSCEYFLCYSRDIEVLNKELWRIEKKGAKDIVKAFNQLKKQGLELDEVLDEIKDLYKRPKYAHLSRWNKIDAKGVFMDDNLSREGGDKDYTVINPDTGKPCPIPPRGWAKSKDELEKLLEDDMIYFGDPSTPPRIKSYLTGEDLSVPDSFWYIDNSIDTRWQKQTFNSLIFENPKPLELIRLIMEMSSAKDSIVLDFFSGSATSAHATFQLNSEDSGNRKFIQVQLPELTDEKSEAYKAGYKNICEIGKERIRRAADKIVNEQWSIVNEHKADLDKEKTKAIPDQQKIEHLQLTIDNLSSQIEKLDTGFRVYRLDSSNMQDVYYKPQDYDQGNLDLFADNVKLDRTADDLLAQVMLDWGLPLSLKIEQVDVSGKIVFKVAENSLYACFDSGIDEDFAKAIAKDEPLRIVFKDSGFKNDTAKTNVKQLLKQLSPETEMKVI